MNPKPAQRNVFPRTGEKTANGIVLQSCLTDSGPVVLVEEGIGNAPFVVMCFWGWVQLPSGTWDVIAKKESTSSHFTTLAQAARYAGF